MLYLDLDEVDKLKLSPMVFSTKSLRAFQFNRSDYHRPEIISLKEAVYQTIYEKLGIEKNKLGPVRILIQVRSFGFCFNPVSFYYVFDSESEKLKVILAEINNTPWNERHTYALKIDESQSLYKEKFKKNFHVSPFMSMIQKYTWTFNNPERNLFVIMSNNDSILKEMFHAKLNMKRETLTTKNLLKMFIRYPFTPFKTICAIYWNALILYLKGAKFHEHPKYKEMNYAS